MMMEQGWSKRRHSQGVTFLLNGLANLKNSSSARFKMDLISTGLSKLKMALLMKPAQMVTKSTSPDNCDLTINIEAFSLQNNTDLLDRLEQKLNDFDSEALFAEIHKDIAEKYDLAREYYKEIEGIRKELKVTGILDSKDTSKQELVAKMDQIVGLLINDFGKFAVKRYALLDEIFLIKTNTHLKYDVDDLRDRVENVLREPQIVYAEEYAKIYTIHEILEEEENRLIELRSQIK